MEPLKTYILTLKLDAENQAFFDEQRQLHFPPAINYLNAHLTLFHKLPDEDYVIESLSTLVQQPFQLEVTKPINIGNGVAYAIESKILSEMHRHLSNLFKNDLILQDRQGYRPHITIQNKVDSSLARALLVKIKENFTPFKVTATGLDLWYYLGGPWEHAKSFSFGQQI
ncbi:2'-5' RNA ligase family protein [Pedobacter petrophilus]|uniref:2'-5' RNA ligase family protein n=1 Tax=Pedobacter petrophilus TaxID=1908241 RepID=A0A7K0FYH0_9SPHI|nr:2'-5' RNA ligase family protein [Pedobacter petrophilus]MRX76501.1 2'-5' RNA ligase family protein [Pedobacter petrophilus]